MERRNAELRKIGDVSIRAATTQRRSERLRRRVVKMGGRTGESAREGGADNEKTACPCECGRLWCGPSGGNTFGGPENAMAKNLNEGIESLRRGCGQKVEICGKCSSTRFGCSKSERCSFSSTSGSHISKNFARNFLTPLGGVAFCCYALYHSNVFGSASSNYANKDVEINSDYIEFGGISEIAKLDEIRQWPNRATSAGLASFFGFCNYYRTLILSFAHTNDSLYKALRSKVIELTKEFTAAFYKLKNLMLSEPIIRILEVKTDFVLETDESETAVGAVFKQQFEDTDLEHPVSFFNKALSESVKNYSAYELEM